MKKMKKFVSRITSTVCWASNLSMMSVNLLPLRSSVNIHHKPPLLRRTREKMLSQMQIYEICHILQMKIFETLLMEFCKGVKL